MPQSAKQNAFLHVVPPSRATSPAEVPDPPESFAALDTSRFELGWLVDEYEKQVAVAEAQKVKTTYAMRCIVEIHNCGYLAKHDAVAYIVALDETSSFSGEIEQIYAAARREQLLLMIDHIHKLLRVGAKNIAVEVNRSLYPPPPPKRGVLARLLFGGA